MRVAALVVLVVTVVACGGGGSPATQRPSTAAAPSAAAASTAATAAPPTAAATAAPVTVAPATEAAPAGGTTLTVVLTGGPDAGSYTATDNPLCSSGIVGTGVWGAQFSVDGAPGKVSVVQIVAPTAASDPDEKFSSLVGIGPLLTSTNYRLDSTNDQAQVTDNGSTAVIHVTGTTEDGVGVEVTVNCPGVLR